MKHNISNLHHWMLRRIFWRLVIQGPFHRGNITEVFTLLAEASRSEFTEDNEITQSLFLRECFNAAMKEEWADGEKGKK